MQVAMLEDRVTPAAVVGSTLTYTLQDNFTGGAATGTYN